MFFCVLALNSGSCFEWHYAAPDGALERWNLFHTDAAPTALKGVVFVPFVFQGFSAISAFFCG
jgi:hypothetical protein